jgi:hypothetical protein
MSLRNRSDAGGRRRHILRFVNADTNWVIPTGQNRHNLAFGIGKKAMNDCRFQLSPMALIYLKMAKFFRFSP